MARIPFFVFATTVLLSGSAGAQTPAETPDRIAYSETEPFGSHSIRWWVDSSGSGWFSETQSGHQPTEGQVTIGTPEFERLSSILRPLESAGACTPDIEDEPMISVTWTRDDNDVQSSFFFSCPGRGREAWERAQQATTIVRRLANGR